MKIVVCVILLLVIVYMIVIIIIIIIVSIVSIIVIIIRPGIAAGPDSQEAADDTAATMEAWIKDVVMHFQT